MTSGHTGTPTDGTGTRASSGPPPETDGSLEEGLDLYRITFEQSGIGLAHLTPEGRFLRVNQKYCDLVGYSEEELLGLSPEDFSHPDDQRLDYGHLSQILSEKGGVQTRERRLLSKDGESTWVLETLFSVQERAGGPVYFLNAMRDISEKKQAEEAFRESEERLLRAQSIARIGFFDLNLKTNEVNWSRNVYELAGIGSQTPVTRETTEGLMHPEDRGYVIENLDSAIEGLFDLSLDFRVVRPDGEVIWVHARTNLERDEHGEPVSLLGTVVDVTDRKVAEGKLIGSEERFRSLMEQSPLGVVIFTPDGKISQVNPAWARGWGLDDLALARVMAEFNYLADSQIEEFGFMPMVEHAFAGGSIVLPLIEYSGKRAVEEMGLGGIEPTTIWIQTYLYSIKDVQGSVINVVGINMDLTDFKRIERESREQRDALARMERTSSMGLLTGSIAHELNQPLTGILSNAQAAEMIIAAGQWQEDEMEEILGVIVSDAKRARDVVLNLRELYAQQDAEPEPVDLNAIVDAATQLLRSELDGQNVTLLTEHAPFVPMVEGNRIQLEQVLVNLILNGMQAMMSLDRGDRHLRVETEFRGHEVGAWVEDRGEGIDLERLDKIFEPLATWRPGGMGMGLAVSNSIIGAHGGQMWAENRPDGGARVGFFIPVRRGSRAT